MAPSADKTYSHLAFDTDDDDDLKQKPSKEGAEEHVRLCKIRKLQEGLEILKEQAIENNVDVPEQMRLMGYVDEYGEPSKVALAADCPEFDLNCHTDELGELGAGYPLFFAMLKYIIMLLFVYTLILLPVILENYYAFRDNPQAIESWNNLLLKDEVLACNQCTGSNIGILGPYHGPVAPNSNLGRGVEEEYGVRCHAWDAINCDWWKSAANVTDTGTWCCMSWCYVNEKCPLAGASSGMEGLYYSYAACEDDPQKVLNCPYGNSSSALESEFDGEPINDERTYEMISPWFLTPGNHGHEAGSGHGSNTSRTPELCYIIISIVTLISIVIAYRVFMRITKVADNISTHPNDFAILVSGLPYDAVSEVEIAEFFERYGLGRAENVQDSESSGVESESDTEKDGCNGAHAAIEVVNCVICWDVSDLSRLMQEQHALHKEKVKLQSHGVHEDPEDERWVEFLEKEEALRQEVLTYAQDEDIDLTTSGYAIVVFRHQEHRRAVERRWRPTVWARLATAWLFHTPSRRLPKFRGQHKLKVKQAPNPPDFLWENISFSHQSRYTRVAVSWLCMLVCMAIAFVVCYLLKERQVDLMEESIDQRTGKVLYSSNLLFSAAIPICVGVMNFALTQIAPILSEREKHYTVTNAMASTMAKLALCTAINGAGIIFAINCMQASEIGATLKHEDREMFRQGMSRDIMTFLFQSSPKQWYQKGGLVNDVTFMLLVGGLAPLFSLLIDIKRMLGLMQAAWIDLEDTETTAADYNQLHEPGEPEIAHWTADVLKNFILAVLFSPLIPLAPLLSGCLLVIYYWVAKYSLLRIKKRPTLILGDKLAVRTLRFFRGFSSLIMPCAPLFFLSPSLTKDAGESMVFTIEIILIVSFMLFLIPVDVQGELFKRGKFQKHLDEMTGQSEVNLADVVEYYEAQHAWPEEWKYRKSHFLYKALPEHLNPETLNPGDQVHDIADAIQKHFKEAVEAAVFESSGGEAAPIKALTVMGSRDVIRQ